MMYVYCRRGSDGARALADALGGQRLRKFDGMDFWRRGRKVKLVEGSTVVCWGDPLPDLEGITVINSPLERIVNKKEELYHLACSGVSTPQVTAVLPKGLNGKWVGRKFYHVGGNDLLNPEGKPDFWVTWLSLKTEYRVHSFLKKSIRAGVKVPRDGFVVAPSVAAYEEAVKAGQKAAHPEIRTYDAGWRINYNGFAASKALRAIAHKAVAALGLTFGAVDIGEMQLGGFVVLEVNRAPGIEDGSVDAYARAIRRMLEAQPAEGEE